MNPLSNDDLKAILSGNVAPTGEESNFDPRDLSTWNLIKGGAARSLEALKGTAADLIPALAASIVGNDEYAKKSLDDYANRMAQEEEIHPTAYKSYKDAFGPNGSVLGYLGETFGEMSPDVVSMLLGSGAASVAGKAIARKSLESLVEDQAAKSIAEKGLTGTAADEYTKRLKDRALSGAILKQAENHGADLGGKYGLFGVSMGMSVPDTLNSVYQDTGDISPVAALTVGPIIGALNTYLPAEVLESLGKEGTNILALKMLDKSNLVPTTWKKEVGKEVLKSGTILGATSAAQTALSQAADQVAGTDKSFFSPENTDAIINSAVNGLAGGVTMGIPVGIMTAGSKVARRAQQIEDAKQAQTQQAQQAQTQQAQQTVTTPPAITPPAAPPTAPIRPGEPPVQTNLPFTPEDLAGAASAQRAYDQKLVADQVKQQMMGKQVSPTEPTITPASIPDIDQIFAESQQQLPLTGGATGPQLGIQDFVGQHNAQQIDAINAAKQRIADSEAAFNDELARTDERVRNNELDRSQQNRLTLLHSILEDPTIQNTTPAFQAALKRAGYTDTNLTEVEQRILQRSDDVKSAYADHEAAKAAIEAQPLPSAPNELTPDVTGIREKDAQAEPTVSEETPPVTPTADTTPVTPIADTAPVADTTPQAPAPANTVITPEALKTTGLKPQSTLFKQLKNKDMTDPEHAQAVANTLASLRENEGIPQETKDAVHSLVGDLFNNATEMGDESGEPRTESDTGASGDGVQVSSGAEPSGTTTATGEPTTGGLGSTATTTTKPRARKTTKSSTLTTEAGEPKTTKLGTKEEQELDKKIDKILGRKSESKVEEDTPTKPFVVPDKYTTFAKDDITNIDDNLAVTKLSRGDKLTPIARAAKTYFDKMPRLVDNLINIAHDLVFNPPRFRHEGETALEAKFFKGMHGDNAKLAAEWVKKNLSRETNRTFSDIIKRFETSRDSVSPQKLAQLMREVLDSERHPTKEVYDETVQKYIDAATDPATARRKYLKDAVSRIGDIFHPAITHALVNGDLQGALRLLAASDSSLIGKIAKRLLNKSPDTKVVVRDNLVDESGKPVAGYFDPKTNTVYLDTKRGMNPHVLMHEVVHSVMSHVLDDPQNLLTRHITQIFNAVKDKLDTAYGAQDIHEFASEAWSNPEFADKLKQIYPDGSDITAWDRFKRAVSNFVRRIFGLESKPLESAYDQLDRLLNEIASPAPDSRSGDPLYAAKTVKKQREIFNLTDRIIEKTPLLGDTQKAALSRAANVMSEGARRLMFSLLPEHTIADMADSELTTEIGGRKVSLSKRFNDLINQKSNYENQLNRRFVDAFWAKMKPIYEANIKTYSAFCDLIHNSTIGGVDMRKPRSTYEGKYDDSGNKLVDTWDEIHAQYVKHPKWHEAYGVLFDSYKEIYNETLKTVDSKIDGIETGDATKVKVKNELRKLLDQTIDPYASLGREGDHWLGADWMEKGKRVSVVKAFKSTIERSKFIENILKKDPKARVEAYKNISEIDYRKTPSGSVINSIFHVLEQNGVPDQAKDELMRLFLNTLPETALMKSFKHRKATPGFEPNVFDTYTRRARSISHQLSNMRYNHQLESTVDLMQKLTARIGQGVKEYIDPVTKQVIPAVPARDNSQAAFYTKQFEKYLRYAKNPRDQALGNKLNSAAFTFTLGFNLSSGLVQLANIPMVVYPYLKGEYSTGEVMKALGEAHRTFMGSGSHLAMEYGGGGGKSVDMRVGYSIANYRNAATKERQTVLNKFKTALDYWEQHGQLNRSQLYEMLQLNPRGSKMDQAAALAGMPMHYAERMNREVTLMATYDLEMDRIKKGDKAAIAKVKEFQKNYGEPITFDQAKELYAADRAMYWAEMTNGGLTAASAPAITHNLLGKVAYMYKRYAAGYYYLLFKTVRDIYRNESPGDRSRAFRQLGHAVGMAALMSGAQGLPLFGLASMIYDLYKDPDDEDLHTVTRKSIGELAFKGLPEYFTNLSIAGRVSVNDFVVRDTSNPATSFTDYVAQVVGGPAYGVADRVVRGYNMFNEGHIERGMENLLPASIGNVFKAYRFATEGAKTLRGDPLTGEVSPFNVVAQALGFSPADYARQSEMNQQYKGIDKVVQQEISRAKQRYYIASKNHDGEGMKTERAHLIAIGRRHPSLEIDSGTVDDVLDKSMKAQDKATDEMIHGVRYSKKLSSEIRQHMSEWGN